MTGEYVKEDFEKLTFDIYPYLYETKYWLNNFPLLDQHLGLFRKIMTHTITTGNKSKTHKLDFNKIMIYVILVFDKGSPLRANSNTTERMVSAGKIAEFPVDENNIFHPEYMAVVMDIVDVVSKMWAVYCKLLGSKKYEMLVYYEMRLMKEMVESQTETDATKRKAILSMLDTYAERIDPLYNEVFAGVKSKETSEMIIKDTLEAITHDWNLRPEDFARKNAEGLPIFPESNPHGIPQPYELNDLDDEE